MAPKIATQYEQYQNRKTRDEIDKKTWKIVEYEQLHQYLRELYGSVLRLAQLSFTVNPVLGAGLAYVWLYAHEATPTGTTNVSLNFSGNSLVSSARPQQILVALMIFISILGLSYNLGALAMYVGTQKIFKKILSRIKAIEDRHGVNHLYGVVNPAAPARQHLDRGPLKYILYFFWSADVLTIFFFVFLICGWSFVFYEVCPFSKIYARLISSSFIIWAAWMLFFLTIVAVLFLRQKASAQDNESQVGS